MPNSLDPGLRPKLSVGPNLVQNFFAKSIIKHTSMQKQQKNNQFQFTLTDFLLQQSTRYQMVTTIYMLDSELHKFHYAENLNSH